MTLQEFKAWFEGYTEGMSGPPNKKQWARIQERVAEIDGQITTYPVYIDRYWHWPTNPFWYSGYSASPTIGGSITNGSVTNSSDVQFDAQTAMYMAGVEEFKEKSDA